jgi:hypothetical protein
MIFIGAAKGSAPAPVVHTAPTGQSKRQKRTHAWIKLGGNVNARHEHFMPVALLDSQFAPLQEPTPDAEIVHQLEKRKAAVAVVKPLPKMLASGWMRGRAVPPATVGTNRLIVSDQCLVGALMAIRFTFVCARSLFGRIIFSTPFLNEASILSSSMSMPTGIRRSNRP